MSVSISAGSIRKRQKYDKSWGWQALLNVTEEGKRRQLTKFKGVACVPPTEDEKGSGRRIQATGKGAREAQRFLAAWRQGVVSQYEREKEAEGTHAMASKGVPEYMDYYWSTRTIRRTTEDGYRSLRNHLDHPLLAKPIGKLTSDDVQAWMTDERENGVSENTLRKAGDQLRYALNFAVKMGHVAKNPCEPIQKPRRSERDPNPLSKETLSRVKPDIEAIRDGGDSSRMLSDTAMLSLHTGMRLGEVIGLRWCDVDGGATGDISKDGKLHVVGIIEDATGGAKWREETKTHKKRHIPMNEPVVRILKRIHDEQSALYGKPLPGSHFVISETGKADKHVRCSRISKEWAKFIKYRCVVGEEGVKPTFHDLRHTFATQALTMGVPVIIVSGILGHENVATTLKYYARWIPDQSADAMAGVGDMLDSL